MTIFVDSSVWYSAVFANDARHALVRKILGENSPLVTSDHMLAAEAVRGAFRDHSFSLIDRTSFVIMERLGITRAASFGDDFVVYRYGTNRERAFEVLR